LHNEIANHAEEVMLSLPELAAMIENILYFRNAMKSFITKIQFFVIPRSL